MLVKSGVIFCFYYWEIWDLKYGGGVEIGKLEEKRGKERVNEKRRREESMNLKVVFVEISLRSFRFWGVYFVLVIRCNFVYMSVLVIFSFDVI